jgi:hypothetical protein
MSRTVMISAMLWPMLGSCLLLVEEARIIVQGLAP